MANKKSAIKRIRSNSSKQEQNRYQLKTCRTFAKKLKLTTDKQAGDTLFRKVTAMLDKLAKRNIIHKHKAANSKSRLAKHVSSLT